MGVQTFGPELAVKGFDGADNRQFAFGRCMEKAAILGSETNVLYRYHFCSKGDIPTAEAVAGSSVRGIRIIGGNLVLLRRSLEQKRLFALLRRTA